LLDIEYLDKTSDGREIERQVPSAVLWKQESNYNVAVLVWLYGGGENPISSPIAVANRR
jgi:hypothetical protein